MPPPSDLRERIVILEREGELERVIVTTGRVRRREIRRVTEFETPPGPD